MKIEKKMVEVYSRTCECEKEIVDCRESVVINAMKIHQKGCKKAIR